VRLYRVYPHRDGAGTSEPGHALYRNHLQRRGRIDNAQHYLTLYASSAAAGAIAEVFADEAQWSHAIFSAYAVRPNTYMALAQIDLPENLRACDMDNPGRLLALGLRPSQVVARDLSLTQAWALRIFQRSEFDGICWWSFYEPRWTSYGIWNVDLRRVRVASVRLGPEHPAVAEAADLIHRRVVL
jgi:RES domain